MKAGIYRTELYPVFKLCEADSYGDDVEIPKEIAKRYFKAYREFLAVQKVLEKMHDIAIEEGKNNE